MRIAYLVHWGGGPETGVFKKILSQVSSWMDLGADVGLFVLCPSALRPAWRAVDERVYVFAQPTNGWRSRIAGSKALVGAALEWRPDVVYRRQCRAYPALLRLAKKLPLVLEINTDDLVEWRIRGGAGYWLHRITRGRLLARCAGVVHISGETAGRTHFRRYDNPQVVIANGIDLDGSPPSPPVANERPTIVFIGTRGHPWHGVDKLLWLSRKFTDWRFELIGLTARDINGDLPSNVRVHGKMKESRYREIIMRADTAVGSLALHRAGITEASPLKVREYLAFGIPTIIGYRDTDFPEKVPYILELPNSVDNVARHVDAIQDFVERNRGKRVPREEVLHLDVRFKEKMRLEFFDAVLRSNVRR